VASAQGYTDQPSPDPDLPSPDLSTTNAWAVTAASNHHRNYNVMIVKEEGSPSRECCCARRPPLPSSRLDGLPLVSSGGSETEGNGRGRCHPSHHHRVQGSPNRWEPGRFDRFWSCRSYPVRKMTGNWSLTGLKNQGKPSGPVHRPVSPVFRSVF
jgi:hypothetical protein